MYLTETNARILNLAAALIDPDATTEDSEYTRGISELLCDVIGVPMDEKEDVASLLRTLNRLQ